ncbi:multi-sensor hybrid histidine kinase [Desulfarculus baarsii DSM 2075]|uniref:histidine kinase n=1 Tax=Desulfarculus baarsii (strain ATCC 33931 / DSM 2075 / LMG 7858 / VKM B-1802 / 2st14) TaxID=644282 RepID=E1QDJ2_DESB2|nr:ATP-binding protein [Desulfarculus baarsii]ADK83511.1 multi-sensor hybrid histidine kinase [Desulfarculus baarsii DSM 2075]
MQSIKSASVRIWAALGHGWPNEPNQLQDLTWWRRRMVEAILLFAVACGLIAYLPGVYLALREDLWSVAAVDTAAYAALIYIWRSQLIDWRIKAGLLLFVSFALGAVLLVAVGFYGAGYLWLLGFCVFAGLIWGLRAAALSFALNLAAMALLGYLLHLGLLDWAKPVENALAKWVVIATSFLFLSAVLSASLSVLFKGLQTSLFQAVEARGGLERSNAMLRQEVMARERTAADLQASEERYRELIESISDCILTHDQNGVLLSINSLAASSLGYRPEQLVGRPIADFLPPTYRERFANHYMAQINKVGQAMGVMEIQASDGQTRYLEYRTALVRPPEGAPYVSGLARDITRRVEADRQVRRLQEQLAQARKMEALGTLAGGIAHDFNNILAAIMGYAEICQAAVADGQGQENDQRLELIIKAAERARDLIRQILTFSRPKGKDMRPTRLGPLIEEVLGLFRGGLPASIALKADLAAGQAVVVCDPTQIQQLLMNLCANAMHAMEQRGGEIRVGLEVVDLSAGQDGLTPGRYARLSVSDDGDGIPKAIADRVFDPFFTTKAEGKGTGMGLAVAHGIVAAHNGRIGFESAPGAGATFRVLLPLAAEGPTVEADRPARPADETPLGGSERVLFVDDEKPLVDIALSALGRLGYQVRGFSDPALALAEFQRDPTAFDVVISDQTMPGMSGLQLIQALRDQRPGLPAILCTGYGDIDAAEAASQARPDILLQKPLGRNQLARALRQALAQG